MEGFRVSVLLKRQKDYMGEPESCKSVSGSYFMLKMSRKPSHGTDITWRISVTGRQLQREGAAADIETNSH